MQAGPSAANVAGHSAPWSAELPGVSERGDTARGEAMRVGDAFTGLEGRDGGRLASTDAAGVLSPPVSPPHRRGQGGGRVGWGRGGGTRGARGHTAARAHERGCGSARALPSRRAEPHPPPCSCGWTTSRLRHETAGRGASRWSAGPTCHRLGIDGLR
jgi:hypothetical protein